MENIRHVFNGYIASLLCREGKQGIKSKTEAIKCCKEITITAPPFEWRNIAFYLAMKNMGICLSIFISFVFVNKVFLSFGFDFFWYNFIYLQKQKVVNKSLS